MTLDNVQYHHKRKLRQFTENYKVSLELFSPSICGNTNHIHHFW